MSQSAVHQHPEFRRGKHIHVKVNCIHIVVPTTCVTCLSNLMKVRHNFKTRPHFLCMDLYSAVCQLKSPAPIMRFLWMLDVMGKVIWGIQCEQHANKQHQLKKDVTKSPVTETLVITSLEKGLSELLQHIIGNMQVGFYPAPGPVMNQRNSWSCQRATEQQYRSDFLTLNNNNNNKILP